MIGQIVYSDMQKLTDSASVTEIFHSMGVNMRYLGKVIVKLEDIPESQNLLFLKVIFERIILAKCLKRFLRHILRATPTLFLS